MILIIEQRITKNKFVYVRRKGLSINVYCMNINYDIKKKKKEQMIKYDNVT